MGVLSKHFYDAIRLSTCQDIVHPHTDNCIHAAAGYFFKPILTTMQFFIPLFMVITILFIDLKKKYLLIQMNKESEMLVFMDFVYVQISVATKNLDEFSWTVFWEMLNNFMGAVTAGLLTGSIGTFFMCGL